MTYQVHMQTKKMLGQLDGWLIKAEEHAKTKGFDVNVLMHARLVPDQFAFARQVQTACDTAKLGASRLTGKPAPSNPDTETTFEELHARIASTMKYLDTFTASDYAGSDTRVVSTPRWEGKIMLGADYMMEHMVPNFFFHVTHAYALLRHNGVDVGKKDYLGPQTRRDP